MTTTQKRAVPLGVPALIGVAGFAAVLAAGGETWQLIVSAVLAAALIAADLQRLRRR